MADIPADKLILIANFIGYGLLGIVAAFGIWWGKRKPVRTEVEVAGALVDSKSIQLLAAAVEGQTMEMIAQRKDAEKLRQAGYRLIDAAGEVAKETGELRRAVSDLANQIARKR